MRSPFLLAVSLALATNTVAQSTYVVDPFNGPGTDFMGLDQALAVAVHGDTVIVRQGGAAGATTDQGITILGEPGAGLFTSSRPMVVQNLPAGRTFRMAGFGTHGSAIPIRLEVRDCDGEVYLESLRAREHGLGPPFEPSFEVVNSAYVHFNNCSNYGAPSLLVQNSTVAITRSYLGLTWLGLGGGECLVAESSTLFVTEPLFDGVWSPTPSGVILTNCNTLIAGSAESYVQGQYAFGGTQPPAGPAIDVRGGTLLIDSAVQLNPFRAGPGIVSSGGAVVVSGDIPGSFVRSPRLETTLDASITAPPNTPVAAIWSLPMQPVPSPFGPRWFDPGSGFVLSAGTVPANGIFSTQLPLPLGLPLGLTLAMQGVTLLGPSTVYTTGTVFVLH